MSDQKTISPLLDGFAVGNPMSTHGGIRCCPAIRETENEKYIVKIISVPSSQVQIDALLLTGAYKTRNDAEAYFQELAEEITAEADVLNTLSKLEGFLPYESWQIVPMEDGKLGYDVYLLSKYRRSLQRYMQKKPVTHLEAVNLGLDLCAALSICRRAGYIYVDLKPDNVFLTREKQFRIGDLGLIRLDSLEYTALPEKYRSSYSPFEVQDTLSTLNKTVDTYAVGMILYQIYNEGSLPVLSNPGEAFPCPANADYEISAIIMKAIDPDPTNRWDDPMAMGQALVRYMQKNTVNNVPIIPPTGILPVTDSVDAVTAESTSAKPESMDTTEEENQTGLSVSPEEAEESSENSKAAEFAEVSDRPEDEQDVDNILSSEESEYSFSLEDYLNSSDDLDFSIAFEDQTAPSDTQQSPAYPDPKPIPIKKQRIEKEKERKAKGIIAAVFVFAALIGLILSGFWLYQNYYLQSIDVLTVDGRQNQLTVSIETSANEALLQISCTDTYGNTVTSPVENGEATFYDLLPDSLYRIEVSINGFHQLTGSTTEIFTTDMLTSIVSMTAATGPEDGSVLLNFTVDGPDPELWQITCSAGGEEDVVQTFTGHTVTVRNLTVGKQYSLVLTAVDDTQIIGNNSTDFMVTNLIMAQNLTIDSCVDGIMTVSWDAPLDTTVERWNVRCYSDDGHEEVLEIAGTEISFSGVDRTKAYTVEVTAAGMMEANRVTLTADPITVSNYAVDTSDPMRLTIDWDFSGNAPADGWLLMYSLDGLSDQQNVVKCKETEAVIEPRIPGAVYHFTLQATDSRSIFGSSYSYECPNAEVFNKHDLSANRITAYLLKTPEEEGWTAETIGNDLYTDTFQSGDSISIVLKADDAFNLPEDVTPVLYVIRDSNGKVLSKYISEENVIWKDLWYPDNYHNCELTIPKVPTEAGEYSISIYFHYDAVAATTFTISE